MSKQNKPGFSLSLNWHHIDDSIKSHPSVEGGLTIGKLNEQYLSLDSQPGSSYMNGLLMTVGVLAVIFLPFMAKAIFLAADFLIFISRHPFMGVISILTGIGFFVVYLGAFFVLYINLIRPSSAPVLLSRTLKKIYGARLGVPIELDWNSITPVITQTVLVSGGAKTLYSLALVQFDPDKEPARDTVQKGVYISTGNLSMKDCAAHWEFLRTYMEESPEKLPETTIQPDDGIPKFMIFSTPILIFTAPAVLFSLLQTLVQRRAKLPAEWLPATSTTSNPFKVIEPDTHDLVLRTRAAWIIAIWLLACGGGGTLAWAWAISKLTPFA